MLTCLKINVVDAAAYYRLKHHYHMTFIFRFMVGYSILSLITNPFNLRSQKKKRISSLEMPRKLLINICLREQDINKLRINKYLCNIKNICLKSILKHSGHSHSYYHYHYHSCGGSCNYLLIIISSHT